MSISVRSQLTAGIAVVGAGAIALAPVAPLTPDTAQLHERVSTLTVELASTFDPFTPWVNTFETAVANITSLLDGFAARPFPIIGQILENLGTYAGELPDVGLILEQVVNNVGSAIMAPIGEDPSNISETIAALVPTPLTDIPLNNQLVFALLPDVLDPETYAGLEPILNFMTSPLSGVLLALIGPVVAPILSVVNSVGAIFDALGESDFIGALNELINIPANAVNAFLNGGPVLDLTPVVAFLGFQLPESVRSLGLNMGGLLSSGLSPVPGAEQQSITGVMFDGFAVSAALTLPVVGTVEVNSPGLSVGPLGALAGLAGSIADAIVVPPPAAGQSTAPQAAAATETAPDVIDATEPADAGDGPADEPAATGDDTDAEADAALAAITAEIETTPGGADAGAETGDDNGAPAADSAGDEGAPAVDAGPESDTDAA